MEELLKLMTSWTKVHGTEKINVSNMMMGHG